MLDDELLPELELDCELLLSARPRLCPPLLPDGDREEMLREDLLGLRDRDCSVFEAIFNGEFVTFVSA